MTAITDFFAMGGYAFYVWTSYALVAAVLVANVVATRTRRTRLLHRLARRTGASRRQPSREAA